MCFVTKTIFHYQGKSLCQESGKTELMSSDVYIACDQKSLHELHRFPNTNFRMRLASLVPSIPMDVVAHLENSGFRTDADVLFTPAFDIFTALPPKRLSLQDVAELISLVEKLSSAAAVPANELLLMDNLAREQDFDLSTGDLLLDANFLGLGGRTVIEISGDRGSGKTVHFVEIV